MIALRLFDNAKEVVSFVSQTLIDSSFFSVKLCLIEQNVSEKRCRVCVYIDLFISGYAVLCC
jgi:hypothetical protein